MAETIEATMLEAGITVYAIVTNQTGQYLDPADWTFKAFVSAAQHAITMSATDQPQVYAATLTTTNFGTTRNSHTITAYKRVGGAPNLTNDIIRGQVQVPWDGAQYASDPGRAVLDANRLHFTTDGTYGRQHSPNFVAHSWTHGADGEPKGYAITYYDTAAHVDPNLGATGQLFTETGSGLTWSDGIPATPFQSATA